MRIQTLTATLSLFVFSWLPGHYSTSAAAQSTGAPPHSAILEKSPAKSPGSVAPTGPEDQEHALLEMGTQFAKEIANELAIAAPEVAAGRLIRDPRTGVSLFAFKVIDEAGEVTSLLFDRRGNLLSTDPSAWLDAGGIARSTIHPDLLAALETATEADMLPVMLWCRTPDNLPSVPRMDASDDGTAKPKTPSDRLPAAQIPRDLPPRLQDLQVFAMAGTLQVAQQLSDKNIAFEIAENSPIIYAKMKRTDIEAIATHPEILECYLESINVPSMATSRQVLRADTVNTRGITGSGVRVGVIEVGGRVNLENPWLRGTQRLDNTCFNNHAAMVAGVIASRHGTHRGIAPDAQLFFGGSCNGVSSQLQSAMTAATNWGVRVINNSWNSVHSSRVPDGNARFIDRLVGQDYRLVVQSAGNTGLSAGNVANPATFYNGLTVGAFDDRGTVTTFDDRMAGYSGYLNPSSNFHD